MSENSDDKAPRSLRVAFIGLGRMGSGMAKNIQAAGFPLTVFNRSTDKTAPFVAAGAKAAASPMAAAAAADVVITSLLDDKTVLDIVTQSDGILAGLRQGAIHFGTTTISPQAATQLAELHNAHGSHYVGCNVLGRPTAAEAGQLAALVAGDPEAVERCRPVIASFTNRFTPVGKDPAAAARMKLAINFFMASLIESMAEVMVFAEKHGLDVAIARDLMVNQVLPNPAVQEYSERLMNRRYDDAGATLITGRKDLLLILSEASSVNAAVPIANLVRDHMLTQLARGKDQSDWCIFAEANRIAAGIV
ncbi:MAG: NAD(P)-dependent oxidoreductase [Chloroflexi bacterium]|nr:NAD(P)-dependent oxidoreductase [Chloroflexota bacterium]